jgi:hypothetical protein
MIKNCGLFDLGYNRPAYTWSNKCFNSNPTYERLDHCLGNAEWCTMFPTTTVYHLPMVRSDHEPILAVLDSNRNKTKKKLDLKTGGFWNRIFSRLPRRAGRNPIVAPSTKKPNSWPLISRSGEKPNPSLLIS